MFETMFFPEWLARSDRFSSEDRYARGVSGFP